MIRQGGLRNGLGCESRIRADFKAVDRNCLQNRFLVVEPEPSRRSKVECRLCRVMHGCNPVCFLRLALSP